MRSAEEIGVYVMKLARIGAAAAVLMACRGGSDTFQSQQELENLAKKVIPRVERAVGMPFKTVPPIVIRSREQVHSYLVQKLNDELPPDELEGMSLAYKLFGLIPDTMDLRDLYLSLYTEQVVGYYDPDSAKMFVVSDTDPAQVRLVLAHELVHALQGQYMELDSIFKVKRRSDRKMAAMAVMEGQATLGSLVALMPDRDFSEMPDFWKDFREIVKQQHNRMPVLAGAPLVVREGIIFPYLAGADFVRWFNMQYPGTVPFGRRLPRSTEQIMHPDRYRIGDRPVSLRFENSVEPIYEDGLGEFETRVLLTSLSGSESVGAEGAKGWAGDHYGVFDVRTGYALVWWTVWDTNEAARRFQRTLERGWVKKRRGSRTFTIQLTSVGRHPAVRLIDAPKNWRGWRAPPLVAALYED